MPTSAAAANEPSYMTDDQFGLRSNRVARPGGARPQPAGARPVPSRSSLHRHSTGRFTPDFATPPESAPHTLDRKESMSPSIAGASVASRLSTISRKTPDYYSASPVNPLSPSDVVPSATYMERGQRWMEKEEASSLRDAMEEMDIRKGSKSPVQETPDDDTRLYNAALDEAAELVWQHQHGTPPPRPDGPYRYKPHLRKNSYAHARTASIGPSEGNFSEGEGEVEGNVRDSRSDLEQRQPIERSTSKNKTYGSIGRRTPDQRRHSLKRNISGEVGRPFSEDQIWEEPEATNSTDMGISGRTSPEKLGNRAQTSTNRVRFEASQEAAKPKPMERVEIYRNPPTRSRNPLYTSNRSSEGSVPIDDKVERKNGMEVRSQDIRAATSMRLKDRSPKLPEPTAVSDSPGRPIVSFDANWHPPDESTDATPDRSLPAAPSRSSSSFNQPEKPMAVPSIVVAEESTPMPRASKGAQVPSICVDETDKGPRGSVPSINVPSIAIDEPSSNDGGIPAIVTPGGEPTSRSRPLPDPRTAQGGPRTAQKPRGHWSPAPGSTRRAVTICHECGFPIDGRFVALAGGNERFHPQCFSCYTCGTNLQAMEISHEPDHLRQERLDRIGRRAAGEVLDEEPGKTMAEDGDERLRFFCHLDWHELFAPRCKHCQTPILGEHIVALGAHWHYGHFFCAECGDPFGHGMTHIEKDGYAWCINCQTKRTERRAPKCRKCRTAVIGQYIQALGGEWHEHCFRCAECQGSFDDGQIFTKHVPEGTIVLCTGCRAMELKA
ncbi:hydrogen peroxide-inducible protein hic-5 [Fusarium flagelliforme]|uniref:Hydrogen peroxide-inducible protein hic-5 n=1 Tax=Fusarium flagelliforme TaxID=2675880 RepID=A0A395MVM4_9HYPO|nr:hydrogen peroxide-inducible protein hic-5 [Fusarium flagelliforme]